MKGLVLLLALSFISPVFALEAIFDHVTPEQPICYGREYSRSHLESHPQQRVQKIRAKFEAPVFGEDQAQWMSVEVTLRGQENTYVNYRNTFFCADSGQCGIDCDGGSVSLSLMTSGDLLINNHGFVLEGGCGAEEDDYVYLERTEGGDDIFRLVRLPVDYCQDVGHSFE